MFVDEDLALLKWHFWTDVRIQSDDLQVTTPPGGGGGGSGFEKLTSLWSESHGNAKNLDHPKRSWNRGTDIGLPLSNPRTSSQLQLQQPGMEEGQRAEPWWEVSVSHRHQDDCTRRQSLRQTLMKLKQRKPWTSASHHRQMLNQDGSEI